MKTRKKISKDKLRQVFRWKSPKRTQKYFLRKYHGTFNSVYTEPIYEIYTKENLPEKPKLWCYSKKVVPFPKSDVKRLNKLKKKQSYVWKISGGLSNYI